MEKPTLDKFPRSVLARIGNWSLTSLQQRLVKAGGRLIQDARYYWLMPAESHLARRLFGGVANRSAAGAHRTGCDSEANRAKPGSGRTGV